MRLIDADEFLENARKELNCCEECCKCENEQFCSIYKNVLSQPTVDAEPVRYGKWIIVGHSYRLKCTECGWQDGRLFEKRYKYCPNCGAKMTEEGNDNERNI